MITIIKFVYFLIKQIITIIIIGKVFIYELKCNFMRTKAKFTNDRHFGIFIMIKLEFFIL